MYYEQGFIYPASVGDPSFHWVKGFLGVAMTDARRLHTAQVATSGVFEFPCLEDCRENDFVTADYVYRRRDADCDLDLVFVAAQRVRPSSEDYAIGQCTKSRYRMIDRYYGRDETCVLVAIQPRITFPKRGLL